VLTEAQASVKPAYVVVRMEFKGIERGKDNAKPEKESRAGKGGSPPRFRHSSHWRGLEELGERSIALLLLRVARRKIKFDSPF
jgi:hypothetical protein